MERKRIKIKVFYLISLYKLLGFLFFTRKSYYKQKSADLITEYGISQLLEHKIYFLGIHFFSIQKLSYATVFLVLSFPFFVALNKYNCFEISFLGIRFYKKKIVERFYHLFKTTEISEQVNEQEFSNSQTETLCHSKELEEKQVLMLNILRGKE